MNMEQELAEDGVMGIAQFGGSVNVAGFVDTRLRIANCINERVDDFKKCIELAYGDGFILTNDDIRHKCDVIVLTVPENNYVVYPVSLKPMGWSWGKLIEVVKATQFLPIGVSPYTQSLFKEADQVQIFPIKPEE